MSVSVDWDDQRLVFTFSEPWDWDDYHGALMTGAVMLDEVGQRTDIIVDFTQSRSLPKGALRHFGKTAENLHPLQGTMVMVGASPFVTAIGAILTRLYPTEARDVHLVKTMEQARALLSRKPWMRGLFSRKSGI